MSETRDYKDTLSLPKTSFPMRAGLAKAEPKHLEHWAHLDLYKKLRTAAKGRTKYILHDGPPYANGHLHAGHAQNKMLKDIITRSQQMMGKDALYVPGWDCHGLPIEWKIEEKYRAKGLDKDDVDLVEFRQECRTFADGWVNVQRDEFKRLGINGEWDNPYLTMNYAAEAQIAREFMKYVMNGGLYQGSKPVMWSVVEKTSLAEAEIEYHDHKSPTIWVKFPIISGDHALAGASIVIWTTTPWTIPANRAVCYSEKIIYAVYEVAEVTDESLAQLGDKLILANDLADDVAAKAKGITLKKLTDLTAEQLAGAKMSHPLRGQGYDFDVPLFAGEHVTNEAGTGFVHTAPGHGADDYEIGVREKLEIPQTVGADGKYFDHVPLFAGLQVIDDKGKFGAANGTVIKTLIEAGAMLAKGSVRHSYPHSWRSKAPIIFRNTPQWFISMDTNDLRKKALNAIDNDVQWFPAISKNRIRAMVEGRPDWVISRQRAWGVPLCCFTHKKTGELLRDDELNTFIADEFDKHGADIWFAKDAAYFLDSTKYDANDYDMVSDILDVWFDSGSTHAFVLEAREDHLWPADLYLEGTDQHRGWFQSSLMNGIGTRGAAPYKAVLTHGFVNDKDGKKMSKSLGNGMDPVKMANTQGADILRLWVGSTDYTDNTKLGDEAIKTTMDSYRKLRNTMRFLLGNISDFKEAERLDFAEMPELERYILDRLHALDKQVRTAYLEYDFKTVSQQVLNFCAFDLSAFYFDIRKDSLYCDAPDSINRRAARTVMDHIFHAITAWLAPILAFTMEEVWQTRFPDLNDSVHLHLFPTMKDKWCDDALADKWGKIREVRKVVTGALEIERREKRIGSSLESAPEIYISNDEYLTLFDGMNDGDFADIFITSQAVLKLGETISDGFTLSDVSGVSVAHKMAVGKKCMRSWKISPDVGSDAQYPDLSTRDAAAVRLFDAA
ncbi:MAG: isoleucine--tRNA ligase [Alphaproteobacteria bacterium]|nr:isoleucine--tRNA ligase [Alphaproteobacteria bacterium]